MSNVKDGNNFDFAELDWQEYIKFRPEYPPALYDTIYKHHQSHNGSFDRALDVGGGVGIISLELLKRFRHVTLSDPSELYISQGKALFSKDAAAAARMSYLVSKLEDMSASDLPSGQPVDLITAGECLHWADVDRCSDAAAGLLNPGGTFSCWLYYTMPVFPEHDSAHAAYDKVWLKMVRLFDEKIQRINEAHGPGSMDARFDNMPFDPAVWKDVRRLYVHKDVVLMRETLPPSKVRKDVEKQEALPEGFMSRDADYEWIEGYWQFLIPPLDMRQNAKGELAELKEAMGGRNVRLDWPVVLVIATKG